MTLSVSLRSTVVPLFGFAIFPPDRGEVDPERGSLSSVRDGKTLEGKTSLKMQKALPSGELARQRRD